VSFYVATESWRDDDGDWIEAGKTFVLDAADCFKKHPARFRRVQRILRDSLDDGLERVGGATALRTKQRAPSRKRPVERDVELLLRGHVDYEVTLGSTARKQILDEIQRAHRAAGQEIEAAGWLFGMYRPRAESSWSEIALATRSVERSGTRDEVFLSDPASAVAAVRAAGYPHLELLGDWHSHVVRGSELPSSADAKAWAGTMDSLGRDAYVSVIVSPSPEMGWMFPRFSAWIAGRHDGAPIVGRARMP
jgi:hypothetical protein